MPGNHSLLPPSSASRWSTCTASVGWCLNLDNPSSSYAEEGTRAHDYAERILTGKMAPEALPEDFKQVTLYTDFCETLFKRHGGRRYVETSIPLFYLPQQTGTVDFALISPHALFIVDLKWGQGVPVSPEWNKQLGTYGLSFMDAMESDLIASFPDEFPVELWIAQPRYAGEDALKHWKTTAGEIRSFLSGTADTARLILSALEGDQSARDKLVFDPSPETCRFCPAAKNDQCSARRETAFGALSVSADVLAEFDNIDVEPMLVLPVAERMTDRQLLTIFTHSKLIDSVMEDAARIILDRAVAGNPVPGTKLVQGRQGNRAWADEAKVAVTLKSVFRTDQVYDQKIKSPAQVDKLLNDSATHTVVKEELKALTSRSDGKPSLALESDRRPGIAAPVDAFSDIPDYDE